MAAVTLRCKGSAGDVAQDAMDFFVKAMVATFRALVLILAALLIAIGMFLLDADEFLSNEHQGKEADRGELCTRSSW